MKPKDHHTYARFQCRGIWPVYFFAGIPTVSDQHSVLWAGEPGKERLMALDSIGNLKPIVDEDNFVRFHYGPLEPSKDELLNYLAVSRFAEFVDHSHSFWKQK